MTRTEKHITCCVTAFDFEFRRDVDMRRATCSAKIYKCNIYMTDYFASTNFAVYCMYILL